MLYIIATPIGNLKDLTYRAQEVLNECDLILCEDTRHSIVLLNHYNIKKPLKSYHKFNEQKELDGIIEDLKAGKNIALISDAGTPGICDPGAILIKKARDENLDVTPILGPCALIGALITSGLPTERFQFIGFLPKKHEALKKCLQEALQYRGTTLSYIPARELTDILKLLNELAPERTLGVSREITKQFEEFKKGPAQELLLHYEAHEPRGEIVLLIEQDLKPEIDWSTLSIEEHVSYMEEAFQMNKKDAIKSVAELRGVPKRTIYNQVST